MTIHHVEMKKINIIVLLFALINLSTWADGEKPIISPAGTFYSNDGEQTGTTFSGPAPLEAHFAANPSNVGDYSAHYEWRFTLEGETEPYLVRHEEETDFTFTKAGSHRIVCYAQFTLANDTVSFTEEYWAENSPLTVTISESRLEFPNAFSPNGDGINDILKAKDGWQSIVEFHAYIYNRWGQLLYDWADPVGGWDGTYGGHDVKQGVYFLYVKAKGADGLKYNIKKDVNLLRGYNEERGNNN